MILINLLGMAMSQTAITGSCKEPSKKPKGGFNASEELGSKPFLSECLDFIVVL